MAGTVNSRSPIKIKTMDEDVIDPRKNLTQLCIFEVLLRLPYLHTCPSSMYPDLPRLSGSLLLSEFFLPSPKPQKISLINKLGHL